MESEILRRIRDEALRLPDAERAELANELVKSLEGPADADATVGWDEELLRRFAEVDAGTARLVDRGEFQRRMHGIGLPADSATPPPT